MSPRMSLRTASRLVVIVLVVVVGSVLALVRARGASTQPLQGTDLSASGRYAPAPAITLPDQTGATISLAGLRGHPVVLTFLYTHCPDECPLTARKLDTALGQLGAAAAGAIILAVSTDPVGDTPAIARAFLVTQAAGNQQFVQHWHYLLGTHTQLAPIWAAYHIAVSPSGEASGTITHTLGLYLIDRQGRERVYLDGDFAPAAVATDLRILAST